MPERRPQRLIGWLLLSLSLLIVGTGAAPAAPPVQAPAFRLQTPQGETVDFPAAAHGRPTVLMFWPSWCPFSRALQPYVQAIWEDYRGVGVNVWTINIKEDKDPVQVMKDRGLSFPLLLQGDEVSKAYRLQYTPWLVVIDGGNRIVYTRPPHPPTPVDTATEVRIALNGLLGERALPLPERYPRPYDLHLRGDAARSPPTATVPDSEWRAWADQQLAAIPAEERVAGIAPRGPVADGKAAIALARTLWTETYGAEPTLLQAPYRSFRRGPRWIVVGTAASGRLGEGFLLVVERDGGQVIRLSPGAEPR